MKYSFADCVLDETGHTLSRAGQPVAVEPLVFDLLLLLARQAGELVTRDQMIEVLWQGRAVSDSAITACIAAARKAVGDDGKKQAIIRTVARRGLQLIAPVTSDDDFVPEQGLQAPNIRYTQSATGQSLAYAIVGDGPPVVRMYPGSHLEVEWNTAREQALFELICRRNRLLRLDPIGIGMSDRKLERFDFDDMAEDIRIAADAAGLNEFILCSESGGVHAALRCAAKYPNRVSRLAILGGYVDGRSRRAADQSSDFLHVMLKELTDNSDEGLLRAFALTYFSDGPIEEANAHARVIQASANRDIQMKSRKAINEVSNAHLLAEIQCPTLIVHGKSDPVHPLSEAQKLATGIRNSELLVLETANSLPLPGHHSWATFAPAFRAFLDA
ncbi:MAG: alpha/beta fold hydrolase [Rhizobiaceae bacterium]